MQSSGVESLLCVMVPIIGLTRLDRKTKRKRRRPVRTAGARD